eukprot:PhM_4_TR19095/c0_g1_i2/m.43880/K20179/VPS11, PEP5; vacuolar protein sorting-associated protein 11
MWRASPPTAAWCSPSDRSGSSPPGGTHTPHAPLASTTLASPVVSFDVTDDLSAMVVCLNSNSGDILFARGDLEHDRTVKVRRHSVRSASGTLQCALIRRHNGQQMHTITACFNDTIVLVRAPLKTETFEETTMEGIMQGVTTPECCAMADDGQTVVATASGLTFLGGDDAVDDCARNAWDPTTMLRDVISLQSSKVKVMWLRGGLVVVVVRPDPEMKPDRFQVMIIERFGKFKLKVMSGAPSIFHNIGTIIADGGNDLLILAHEARHQSHTGVEQRVARVTERDTQTKLDLVYRKDEYDIAVAIAQKQGFDEASIAEIRKRYGDHLHDKGAYDEAIPQYISTIGTLEPSYVIRRFLDVQRIRQLTHYLEELHDERHLGVANEQHTTLLLNCFTKLRMDQKLTEFIGRKGIRFDAETAIRVCRQAGYYDQALQLALQNNNHHRFVSILLERRDHPDPDTVLRNCRRALRHIEGLPLRVATPLLQTHGKGLLGRLPSETTAVMMAACTNWGVPDTSNGTDDQPSGRARTSSQVQQSSPSSRLNKNVASADTLIHAFVDSPGYLLQFLECVVEHGEAVRHYTHAQKIPVYNTLLELYLTPNLRSFVRGVENVDDAVPSDFAARRRKALALLNSGMYDEEHALFLVKKHQFSEGLIVLLGRMRLYGEIFSYHETIFNHSGVLATPEHAAALRDLIAVCDDHGEEEPDLWGRALQFCVGHPCVADEELASITKPSIPVSTVKHVLQEIRRHDLLPPLAVFKILSRNPTMPLGTVRAFVIDRLQGDVAKIQESRRAVQTFTEESERCKAATRAARTSSITCQSNRCDACNGIMELPAVHFLCHHGFHGKCLNKSKECNICGPRGEQARERRAQFNKEAGDVSELRHALFSSEDPYHTLSTFFSKGIFGVPKNAF